MVDHGADVSLERGTPFVKMSGSGNDFIFFDLRSSGEHHAPDPDRIRRLCARGVGVGADGVVLLERSDHELYGMRYFNADGSLASLCGNATLCAARLGLELGIVSAETAREGFRFETGVGAVEARVSGDRPEIELTAAQGLDLDVSPATGLAPGERRLGYVEIGVPHVVILCDDAETAPLMERGPRLRYHAAFPQGANVNFVSRGPTGWRYRTYERGVENETLACGTGAAACATLLRLWGEAGEVIQLRTSSGDDLEVTLPADSSQAPRLRGRATIVYRGELSEG